MHINPTSKPAAFPIAVIGVSCRFPGAPNLEAFARLLAAGTDAVTEIPRERWTREAFLHPDPRQRGRSYTVSAGVIDDIDSFDAAFFGISPREAVQMDPQQRILLELTYAAIEDAGMTSCRLAEGRTGVFVGASSSDYLALRLSDPSVADAYFMSGSTLSTLSNRISYTFDLKGPSFTVDTACSSSLVALHQACGALRRGEVNTAVVGGVNLLLAPQYFVGFSRALMLSPRGRCHAFAAGADGYVRAEGAAIMLLKPLHAALTDGDSIACVIEATAVNSDGRTTGLSLPSRDAQAALLRDVYAAARIDPDDLVYFEAHGTGTAVGDPIEAGAIGDVLGRGRTAPLPVGSVKTNIGHLEAGSGMAGLLKAMLVLRHGHIPASLHCDVLNPAIDFDALNLMVAREAMPVVQTGRTQAVGINSFGFGGTNAHAVLSLAPARLPDGATGTAGLPPLLISAKSEPALASLVAVWRDRLAGLAPADAVPLLRAAARGRDHHLHRLAAIGNTPDEIAAALDLHRTGRGSPDVATNAAVAGRVAFVYSGNGCQWAGMALDAMQNRAFGRAMEEVDAELAPRLGWSVAERLGTVDALQMRRTDIAQPLLFAVQAASVVALRDVGIVPSAHIGHSVGEVAAAYAAGALSLADAAHVIVARSNAQQATSTDYGMGVLGTTPGAVQPLLDMVPEVEIAAINSRTSITLAGPREALQRLARLARRRQLAYLALDLDYGFHSTALDPVRASLLADLEGITSSSAKQPFYSTVLGGVQDGSGLNPDYWWQNMRLPVRFADTLAAAIADGCTILLEVGPKPVLLSYLRDGLRRGETRGHAIQTLSSRSNGEQDPFRRIAAQVHVAGHDISGAVMFDGSWSPETLPRYPFQRQRFWYERTEESTDVVHAPLDHPLLGFRRGDAPALWYNTLDLATQPWLADHAVDGVALLPATAIIEIALAAARARHPEAERLDVLDLEIARPLLLERDVAREMRVTVAGERGAFELASRVRLTGTDWTVHATGRVQPGTDAPLSLPAAAEGRRIIPAPEFYALTSRLGLQYGPAFQTVSEVRVGEDGRASLALIEQDTRSGYLLDPARADGAFQGLVALAPAHLAEQAALLPWRIGRVRLDRKHGTAFCEARLRIGRVGPRSVSAEVTLLDAMGKVVAQLSDCWFARFDGAHADKTGGLMLHAVTWPLARAEADDPVMLLPPLDAAAPARGLDEAMLLMEAFVAAAGLKAIEALADEDSRVDPAALVAAGRVHPSARALLGTILSWLERDGLAQADAGNWTIDSSDELPAAADIWRSVVADAPQAVAEATLSAVLAEALPAMLATGPAGLPGGLSTLTAQLASGSPTACAALDALSDAVTDIAARWPARRPLRVLELGAADPDVTARLAAAATRSGVAVAYTALLMPGADAQAVARSSTTIPALETCEWTGADTLPQCANGPFDLIVGLLPLTRPELGPAGPVLLGLRTAMVQHGVLLLAEAAPNRVWDLRFGLQQAWWRTSGTSRQQDAAGWSASLEAAGFTDVATASVGGVVWDANLIRAVNCGAPAVLPEARPETKVLVIAESDDVLARAVAEALEGGRLPVMLPHAGAAEMLRNAAPSESDILLFISANVADAEASDTIADAGALLAACTGALAESAEVRLWVVVFGVNTLVSAAVRGIVRVLANEAPNIRPRFLSVAGALDARAAASMVVAELCQPDAETELALGTDSRNGVRLRRGLGRTADAGADMPCRLGIGRPGLLDTLRWEAMAVPTPDQGEVAIAVEACGLNFRDVMWSLGLLPDEALLDGLAGPTLGLECAGTVIAVGPGVDTVRPGDRVMAIAPACLATHVLARAQAVLRLPDDVGFAAAATMPVAFLTVCYALGVLANLQPGERVLIHGGAGGVGLAAIQFARHRGAEIFASAGSPAKRAMLRLLGVNHVLDSRSLAFADEIMQATGGQGVDVVLNSLAGEAMERSVGVLRPFGRFLELGKRDLYGNTPLGLRALRHNVSYFAIDADQLPTRRPDMAARVFATIAELMQQGVLKPLPYSAYRFSTAVSAFRLMQSAGHIGKIVLQPELGLVAASQADDVPGLDGVVVVTGGLTGFGLATARWLIGRGARRLALIGRRGAETPGAAETLATWAGEGVDARAYAGDVADAHALGHVLDAVRAGLGPITAVIHAAVVLDDGQLPSLDAGRFARVLAPKLDGALALDRLTRSDPLALFVVYGSITTTLGNPGQANYVAANAAMAALVEQRRAAGLPGLSVGWGPIGDVGMLARDQALSAMLEKRLGSAHLGAVQALDLLPALLASGHAYVDVGHVRWGELRRHLPHLGGPMFTELLRGQGAVVESFDLVRMLADCTPEEARTLVGGVLAEEVSAITKAPVQQIDLDRSLTDIGMDSLMAVELRLALERRFGGNLPLLSLSDGASIGSIAARIVRQLSAGTSGNGVALEAIIERYEQAEETLELEETPHHG